MKTLIILLIASCATFSTFAQTKSKTTTKKTTTRTYGKLEAVSQVKYTCSMHPEVVSSKPGKCPKCQMDLTKVAKTYTCSMHPDVVSSKPGKCPKCQMDLVEDKTDSKTKKS